LRDAAASGRSDATACEVRCIALHDAGGDARTLEPLATSLLARGRAWLLQGPRALNPLAAGAGVAAAYRGYRWYLGTRDQAPEASSFGDALAALEASIEAAGSRPLLVAEGQACVLAVALARLRRDLVGALALLPTGWRPLEVLPHDTEASPLAGLPVWLCAADGAGLGEEAALRALGADLCVASEPDWRSRPEAAAGPIADWRSRAAAVAAALVLATTAMVTPAQALSTGPQPGVTGVPAGGELAAEMTCVQCHATFTLNPDDRGALAIEGLPERWEPGRSYELTVRLTDTAPESLRWGFQATAVFVDDLQGAGTFEPADQRTQVVDGLAGRAYIEHSYYGTDPGTAGGASWSFRWTAPDSGTDSGTDIAIFAAGNAANVNGSQEGDRIFSPSPEPLAVMRAR
jgi:hypothetical protein